MPSQFDLLSLTTLSVAIFGRLQLRQLTIGLLQQHYYNQLTIDPTFCDSRFSTGWLLAIEDFAFSFTFGGSFLTHKWAYSCAYSYAYSCAYSCANSCDYRCAYSCDYRDEPTVVPTVVTIIVPTVIPSVMPFSVAGSGRVQAGVADRYTSSTLL